jgi:hypothetical protein
MTSLIDDPEKAINIEEAIPIPRYPLILELLVGVPNHPLIECRGRTAPELAV